MASPARRSRSLSRALTDTPSPGTTAAACALTSSMTWSRSLRRNGRTWIADMNRPPRRMTTRDDKARYLCGTNATVTRGWARRSAVPRVGAGVEDRPADLGAPLVLVGGAVPVGQVVLADRPVHGQRVLGHVAG